MHSALKRETFISCFSVREAKREPYYPACPRSFLIRDCRWVRQSRIRFGWINLNTCFLHCLFLFVVFFRHAKDNKGFDEEEEGMQNMMYFFCQNYH